MNNRIRNRAKNSNIYEEEPNRRPCGFNCRSVLDWFSSGWRQRLPYMLPVKVMISGNRPELSNGYFIEPTKFDGVAPTMRIFKEEILGQVLSIATAKNLGEALNYANGVEYGLTMSIFTENIYTIMRSVDEVETARVHVNEPTIGGEAQPPFGVITSTGVGDRAMAEEGLNRHSAVRIEKTKLLRQVIA